MIRGFVGQQRVLLALPLALLALAVFAGVVARAQTPDSASGWEVSVAAGGAALRPDVPAALPGSRDGAAQSAEFDRPVGMALAPDGSVYIADSGNHRIRRLTPSGDVETVAGSGTSGVRDGEASVAEFRTPVDVAVAPDGTVFIVDAEAGQIRSLRNGQVATIAGVDVVTCFAALETKTSVPPGCPERAGAFYRDGAGPVSLFNQPTSVVAGPSGELYVADSGNQVLRRIGSDGVVSLYAGVVGQPGNTDGSLRDATFFFPVDLAWSPDGDLLLTEGSRIRRITSQGQVSTLAGSRDQGADAGGFADGDGMAARFRFSTGLAVRDDGTLFVADSGNQRVREVKPLGQVSTAAGRGGQGMETGSGSAAQFSHPVGAVVLEDGSLLVSDYNLNRIFHIRRTGP